MTINLSNLRMVLKCLCRTLKVIYFSHNPSIRIKILQYGQEFDYQYLLQLGRLHGAHLNLSGKLL